MRLITFLNEVATYDPSWYLRDPSNVASMIATFLVQGEHLGNVNSSVYATDEILEDFEGWLASEHGESEPDYNDRRVITLLRDWCEQRYVRENMNLARETLNDINGNIKGEEMVLYRSTMVDPGDVKTTILAPPGKDHYPMSTLHRDRDGPITLGRFWTYDEKWAQQYHQVGSSRVAREVKFAAIFSTQHVDIISTIATSLIWNEKEVRLKNQGFDIPCKLIGVQIEGQPQDVTYAKNKRYMTEDSI